MLDGRYRIVRLIKAGGMGAVYEGLDVQRNIRCAIKEMLDASESAEDRHAVVDRFLGEVQVLQRIAHPNIPRMMDSFYDKNSFYFVMEFVEGIDLGSYLKEHGKPGLDPKKVMLWAWHVLNALEYTHAMKPPVVHRDIKPSNIIDASIGRAYLIDFGIAWATNPEQEDCYIGTPGYAPPEQQMRIHEPRSDLYALGATMHELLTGIAPTSFEFAGFQECGIKIERPFEEVIEYALATFPQDRWESATAMKQALENAMGYKPSIPVSAGGVEFTNAVQAAYLQVIDPLLRKVMEKYRNECMTLSLPQQLEFLTFTLGPMTPFELVIKRLDQDQRIEFVERQGILAPNVLGRVNPMVPAEVSSIKKLIDRFVSNYEEFKNDAW